MAQHLSASRHRSSRPVSTPFGGLNLSLAVSPGVAGRGGVVLALSSGLVAGVALPAVDGQATETAGGAGGPSAAASLLQSGGIAGAPAGPQAQVPAVPKQGRHAAAPAHPTTKAPSGRRAARPATHVPAPRTVAQPAKRAPGKHAGVAPAPVKPVQAKPAPPKHAAPPVKAPPARPRAAKPATKTPTKPRVKPPAKAAPKTAKPVAKPAPKPAAKPGIAEQKVKGSSVVAVASRYLGVPYLWGGTTPRGFDCSGLTQYVFKQLGADIPRNSQKQYDATTHIKRSDAEPGDLVFFFTGGKVHHVAIYLGGDKMLAAPHAGAKVRVEAIYSADVAFGRVT